MLPAANDQTLPTKLGVDATPSVHRVNLSTDMRPCPIGDLDDSGLHGFPWNNKKAPL
jgi:hypothetical protein